jgi:hypothetical protein
MSEGSDISILYREFADALTEVLAENAVGPARRGRLARARAAVKHHPDYSEAGHLRAVEAAFENWEAMQRPVVSTRLYEPRPPLARPGQGVASNCWLRFTGGSGRVTIRVI